VTNAPQEDGDPRPLTAAEINELDLVETIMLAPLDQAVGIAVGRASTCWRDVDGSFGMAGVFDDQTACQIVDALLARISAELAGSVAEVQAEERVKAAIPTLKFPTEVRQRGQCEERVRIEGYAQHSQCLLLAAHPGDEHQNGNLRWRKDQVTGEITSWFDTTVYETVGLGDLLRSGVHLTLPHLPIDAVAPLEGEPDTTARITHKSGVYEIEGSAYGSPIVRELVAEKTAELERDLGVEQPATFPPAVSKSAPDAEERRHAHPE
jgi:hypothetical protein